MLPLGKGVFASKLFEKGEFLLEYREVLTTAEAACDDDLNLPFQYVF